MSNESDLEIEKLLVDEEDAKSLMITILISIGSVFIVLLIVVLVLIIYRIKREKASKIIRPSRIVAVATD